MGVSGPSQESMGFGFHRWILFVSIAESEFGGIVFCFHGEGSL